MKEVFKYFGGSEQGFWLGFLVGSSEFIRKMERYFQPNKFGHYQVPKIFKSRRGFPCETPAGIFGAFMKVVFKYFGDSK